MHCGVGFVAYSALVMTAMQELRWSITENRHACMSGRGARTYTTLNIDKTQRPQTYRLLVLGWAIQQKTLLTPTDRPLRACSRLSPGFSSPTLTHCPDWSGPVKPLLPPLSATFKAASLTCCRLCCLAACSCIPTKGPTFHHSMHIGDAQTSGPTMLSTLEVQNRKLYMYAVNSAVSSMRAVGQPHTCLRLMAGCSSAASLVRSVRRLLALSLELFVRWPLLGSTAL